MSVPVRARPPAWVFLSAAVAPVVLATAVIGVLLPVIGHPHRGTWILLGAAAAGGLVLAVLLSRLGVRAAVRTREPLEQELRRSEQLRADALARLGSVLAATHDLDRILGVTLEAAMACVGAPAGAVFLTLSSGEELQLTVGRGLEERLPVATRASGRVSTAAPAATAPAAGPEPAAGGGVVARVATTGDRVFGSTAGGGLALAADEPRATSVLAVPLHSGGRVTGVVALYDAGSFAAADADLVEGFLSRAELAVDNVLLHQETQRLSITDGLTGLWNYRYATLALAREVERASRFRRPLAVLMLDLDRFKRVNDMFGHQRGDAVLAEVATRVRTVVRDIDILARYGGEELVLMLPETDEVGAVYLAGRVMDAIRGEPIGEPGETPLRMTSSIGIALHPQHGDSPRALLRAADSALYAAKAAGRDRCLLAEDNAVADPDRSWREVGIDQVGRSVLDIDADPPRTVLEMNWRQGRDTATAQELQGGPAA